MPSHGEARGSDRRWTRFSSGAGVGAGQRVVLLAPNSSAWLGTDLALMFEGISVPIRPAGSS